MPFLLSDTCLTSQSELKTQDTVLKEIRRSSKRGTNYVTTSLVTSRMAARDVGALHDSLKMSGQAHAKDASRVMHVWAPDDPLKPALGEILFFKLSVLVPTGESAHEQLKICCQIMPLLPN